MSTEGAWAGPSDEWIWVRSSYSGSSGDNCVEVARARDVVRVRDSKDPDGGALVFPATSWAEFLTEVSSLSM
jgi:hypothetical protein